MGLPKKRGIRRPTVYRGEGVWDVWYQNKVTFAGFPTKAEAVEVCEAFKAELLKRTSDPTRKPSTGTRSGRPKISERGSVRISVSVSQEQDAWLAAQGSRSKVIQKLITGAMEGQ